MYFNLSLVFGLLGWFGLNSGGTGLVGFPGLGLGTGCGLYLVGLCGTGLGAGLGFGAGGNGLGTFLLMYQAWFNPLWQFQKITCLMCLFCPP